MEPDKRDPIACLIIDGLNGTVAVADLCEIDPGAVSQWRKKGIPKGRLKFLKLACPNFNWSQVPQCYASKDGKASETDGAKQRGKSRVAA